jgi:hypothetical protein
MGLKRINQQVQIEAVVDFWNRRPCNVRHSPKLVGSLEYFEEVEARKYFVEPHIPRFADFPRWNGKRALAIGCGIGTDTISVCPLARFANVREKTVVATVHF